MKTLMLLVALTVAAHTCFAADDTAYTTNNAFSVSLSDGSVILCNPQIEKVPVKTSYADLTIPLDRIAVISNALDTSESLLLMKNGDIVRGKCDLTDITVISILGKLTIPMANITEINSRAKRKRTFNDSPSRRNACINNLRMLDAAKEQWALASRQMNGAEPVIVEINHYIKGDTTPICPAGGEYTYDVIGKNPTCDCPGHKMPGGF